MIRIMACIVLATGAWLATPAPAQAAQSYDNCTGFINSLPATISTQGTWCLNKDLATGTTSGAAITIAANNVTLDCNHFKIGGLAAGTGTSTAGAYAEDRFNTTVRNCNIRGFYRGLQFFGGGGHLVEDNRFDGNTRVGVSVASPGSTIRNNLVIDTGGSVFSVDHYGIFGSSGVDILDNTVDGVMTTVNATSAVGITAQSSGADSTISGNRVRGLAPAGSGLAYGITIYSRGIVRDNDVQGPGPGVVGSVGVHCGSNVATARDNVISGFETSFHNCTTSSNIVNTN